MEAFEIYGGRKNLWQWELGQKVTVNCECDTVVFECQQLKDAPVVEPYLLEGQKVADIPNCLLAYAGWIRVFGRKGDGQAQQINDVVRLVVLPAAKPQEYVYTEVEIRSWERLADRIKALEDGVIIWRDADGTVHPLPAEFMPTQLIQKLFTRDVRVGGKVSEDGTWDPSLDKSRLAVSGTLELHGKVEAEESHFYMKLLNVLSEMKVGGTATFENEVKMLAGLKVSSQIEAGGAKLKGTLDMKQNDVKNVQSLEVEGTADLKGDIKILPNTNRPDQVKISDALNEALDWTFKKRLQLYGKYMDGQMHGEVDAFRARLTWAISRIANKAVSASIISIGEGSYEYPIQDAENASSGCVLQVPTSITLFGAGKQKTEIRFVYDGTQPEITLFQIQSPEVTLGLHNVRIVVEAPSGTKVNMVAVKPGISANWNLSLHKYEGEISDGRAYWDVSGAYVQIEESKLSQDTFVGKTRGIQCSNNVIERQVPDFSGTTFDDHSCPYGAMVATEFILQSPGGDRFRVTVDDDGGLHSAAITE